MKKELILIRHGHSEWQAGTTRDRNSHLTGKGIREAGRLYNALPAYANVSDFHLISSPLHRAVETSRLALSPDLFSSVRYDRNFREASFHVRGGLSLPEDFYPEANGKVSSEYQDFKAGIKAALAGILAAHDRVMIFTHGGVIKTILRLHCGSDAFCTQIDNCSVTHFVKKDAAWLLQRVNHRC
ncbi:histidine phosphatase family protein [Candidatus Pantoea floridensis]|uniref:Probable phosphoglycerate mutase n=1 Tax=Candidatus Pantoea floridensis TaxID=1938870 RepID=A0A286DSS1_9GAMM|nr:histidine phosphatase family protein [Pantoea floridensis]PIF06760.1 putative phosphoglycerate mutase [Enterobacteriaceae bacterium JKS000233]SOD61701.1 probable phosphoglycerate mutase [Pantoea floridensis]